MYILASLSKERSTGYDIMQRIEERTEGGWRPGPGTVYPLLKALVKERLLSALPKSSKSAKVVYSITKAGEDELSAMRSRMTSLGRKERVFMRLALELVPTESLAELLLSRAREGSEFLRSVISGLPEPDRTAALREFGTIAENQLDWVRSNLGEGVHHPRRREALR